MEHFWYWVFVARFGRTEAAGVAFLRRGQVSMDKQWHLWENIFKKGQKNSKHGGEKGKKEWETV